MEYLFSPYSMKKIEWFLEDLFIAAPNDGFDLSSTMSWSVVFYPFFKIELLAVFSFI